ncbi:MAG: hypothetical protein HC814_00375 [Rhodobacteraceae bacterium]|nr:hypothetical protein [Paracoccaceae bacterium]
MNRHPRKEPRAPGGSWLRRRLPMESETSWLLLLGVLDLILTVVLRQYRLRARGEPARPPLPRQRRHPRPGAPQVRAAGLRGRGAQIIALRHPRVAQGVLYLGVLGQLVVVCYSASLLVRILR